VLARERIHVSSYLSIHGAGEGNRTLVLSLGSSRSAIELHPHSKAGVPRQPLRTTGQTLSGKAHVDSNASRCLRNSETID
jgi:hypothetical protein